jgi:methyl-accepting chemotaxis protein
LGTTNTEGGATGFFKNIGNALGSAVKGPMMLSAAAGYAAAGIALTKLSVGLKAFKSVGWTDTESTILATALTGISGAFASAGGEAPSPGGVFGAIFGNAFSPNATEKGIDSVMNAGKALTGITEGLISFQQLIDKDVDFEVLGKAITDTVGIVQTAFAAIGGEGNVAQGGFFGSLLGLEQNKVEEGIDSVMNAGKALTGIVDGLTAFQVLVEQKVDFEVLGKAISDTVGFVQKAFSAVAEEGTVEAGGFFNSLFGIKKNKVQEGIDSVSEAGAVLKSIADGLIGFQSMIDSKVDFATLGKSISTTIGFVQSAFAAVADEGTAEAGGFFNSLFGIKKNKVQEGIDSVSGAGDQLKSIADALTSFAGLKDPAATAKKVKTVLGLVGTAFASIGGAENEESDGNWFISWDENKVAKGIDAVDGAGSALTDIASGLKAFSGDFEPVKVANSVATLLTSIGTAFSDLYATNPFIAPQLHDFSTFIVTLGNVAEKGLLDKAADGISKIADSINKIDIDKTVAFGDLFKSSAKLSEDNDAYKSLAKAVEDIRDIMQEQKAPGLIDRGLNAIGLGSDKAAAPAAATKGADPMKKLNSTLGRLENAITALPTAIQTMKLEVSIPGQ